MGIIKIIRRKIKTDRKKVLIMLYNGKFLKIDGPFYVNHMQIYFII